MKELAKQFIGEECIIYTVTSNDGSVLGVIKEIGDGSMIIERKSGEREIINLDFVTRIREYPKKKNGKKKNVLLDNPLSSVKKAKKARHNFDRIMAGFLAEMWGFEPQHGQNPPTGFRIRTLQPLGYISMFFDSRSLYQRRRKKSRLFRISLSFGRKTLPTCRSHFKGRLFPQFVIP